MHGPEFALLGCRLNYKCEETEMMNKKIGASLGFAGAAVALALTGTSAAAAPLPAWWVDFCGVSPFRGAVKASISSKSPMCKTVFRWFRGQRMADFRVLL